MAWRNLHNDILNNISEEAGISINSDNLNQIYYNYLIKHSELYLNDRKMELKFLTGTIHTFS
jgi:hypothetical protein